MNRLLCLLLALPLLLSAGCATHHRDAPKLLDRDGRTLEKTRYHGELVATDGKRIRFTVWQPPLRPGQTAPLILHAHGFALTRMNSKMDLYAKFLLTGQAALDAWNRGYWVISFDQRGHGGSQGKVGLMEWDKEIADVSLLIDWAQKNLAVTAVDGDPKVGMIGESYGGGVQLLASVADPRIDALVPVTTWYDLERALIPDGVPKSEWILFLGVAGYGLNTFHMDGQIAGGMFREILFDDPQPDLRGRLHRNSLAFHCDGGSYPHADALIIQGFRDVIFPVNDAVKMRDCFRKGGRDARVIGVEHGHLAPTAQLPPIGKIPIWHVAPNVRCEGRQYALRDMIVNWFDIKLRDRHMPDSTVPAWCMSGDRTVDAAQAFPEPMQVDVPAVHVGSGASGLFEWFMRPLDAAGNWFVPARMPEDWAEPSNGWLRPARVPLLAIDGPTWVLGSARAELDVFGNDRPNPILFLRLAAWKPGSGMYRILSQQVTPIRGTGRLSVELGAVRAKLEKGEVVGLLVNGYSNQFRLTGSGWGTDASIAGTITLPVAGATR
ncbi:MAG: alpha/beta hydrolase family protein [Pseudomonadota bacterium]